MEAMSVQAQRSLNKRRHERNIIQLRANRAGNETTKQNQSASTVSTYRKECREPRETLQRLRDLLLGISARELCVTKAEHSVRRSKCSRPRIANTCTVPDAVPPCKLTCCTDQIFRSIRLFAHHEGFFRSHNHGTI